MRAQADRTGLVALVIALVAAVGAVIAVPSLLPTPLRDLVGLGPERLGEPPHPTGSGPYAFLATQPGDRDRPVGYDPCERIPIRVNLAGAPSGSLDLVKQAIGVVEGATGLRFDYQGTSSARPRWHAETVPVILGRPQAAPVLVSWATAEEVGALAGRVAGVGGSVAIADSNGEQRYVTGGITLDADAFAAIDAGGSGKAEELAIVLHEFGHLVGLGHVADDGELMNAENTGQLGFGPGDLVGLAKIGSIDCG